MNRRNDVKAMLAYYDVQQWKLAEYYDRSEAWICKKLRNVTDEEYEEYVKAIKFIASEG